MITCDLGGSRSNLLFKECRIEDSMEVQGHSDPSHWDLPIFKISYTNTIKFQWTRSSCNNNNQRKMLNLGFEIFLHVYIPLSLILAIELNFIVTVFSDNDVKQISSIYFLFNHFISWIRNFSNVLTPHFFSCHFPFVSILKHVNNQ